MKLFKYLFACLLLYSNASLGQEVKSIHIHVALCDNVHQGIVKVPKAIGNGQDPKNNLYWGCGYGISTYFKKSQHWKEVKRYAVDSIILERVIFKHKTMNYYLIADAYDGKSIATCTHDFLNASAGKTKQWLEIDNTSIGIKGNSEVIAYIGHNGLMDFSLKNSYKNTDNKERKVIILACAAKSYFTPYLRNAKAYPLVWTTNLMAPEAYTIHDAIETYLEGKSNEEVRECAAKAYSKFQKCSLKTAKGLLVTGY